MGSRYLTELAVWCREAGLEVHEMHDWQTNARGSGGYDDDKPWCIMWHHTASATDPEDDAAYIAYGHEDSPIANVLLDRTGAVWICAAGATNTNGKGGPFDVSRGRIPKDSMNTYAIGIEAANNGVGEPWPEVQVIAYFALNNKLTEKLGLLPTDLGTHSAYAPSRKIDPATAAAVLGEWQPSSVNSSGSWDLQDVRDEAFTRAGSVPLPPDPEPGPDPEPQPPSQEDDVIVVALETNGTAWVGNGIERTPIDGPDIFDRYMLVWRDRFVNTSGVPVHGWDDVGTVDDLVLATLGRPR